jgi:hypothetical protein
MFKPLCAAVVAVATFAALVTAATPSAAAGTCSIVLPAKVSISSGSTVITGRRGLDCVASNMESASWTVSPSNFGDTFFFFGGAANASYTFYSNIDRIGPLRALGTDAWDSGFNALQQNNPTFVVKYATWAYINTTRSGSHVHVGGLVHQWSSNDMGSPSGRKVWLQRYRNGAWQNMVSQLSNSSGKVSFGFVQSAVVQYRLAVTESSRGWSAASGSSIR